MILEPNATLESALSKTGVTVVDFFASWCGPCKMMNPIMDAIDKNGIATVVKVDTELHPDIAEKYSVKSLPTICFFKDGTFIEDMTQIGATPKPKLEQIINSL